MLLLLKLKQNVPTFFRPRITELLKTYVSLTETTYVHIISELPKFIANEYRYATHNIYLSRHEPHWLHYSTPYAQCKTDTDYFTFYHVNIHGMNSQWELLGDS